jgi:hypothetical protein
MDVKSEIPDRVWKLYEDPSKWTQGEFARDKNGKATLVWDREAVCWCLSGAISLVYRRNSMVTLGDSFDREELRVYLKIRNELEKLAGTPILKQAILSGFNDSATFEEVRDLCKKLDV